MYTMKEICESTGLSEHTVRYYDREGLIPLLERTPNGNRKFSENDLEWLQLICCLKRSGMPLEKIKKFMQLCLGGQSTCEERKELLLEHRAHIQDQMKALQDSLDVIDYKIDHYKTVGVFHIDPPEKKDEAG
ncbi:MAG: MerR family transcriptional regulator [Lachnospiraceae bacterium]|jgi:DNA-binding transcriptional MerR regulator|nr:MerR family transcriptional regulator [Lachnospiraceae bacterium]